MSKSNQINTARRFWGQFITAATGACSGGLGCTGSPQSLDILGHYSLEMIRGPCELQSRVTVASQEAEQGHEACKQLQPHPCRTLLRLQHAWAPAVAFGSLPPAWHAPRCRRWPRCAWRARRHRGGRSRCASTCSGQASRGQEMASRHGRLSVHTSAARAQAGQGLPGLLHVSAAVHLVVPGQLLQQRRCPRHPSCRSSFTRQCRRGGTNGCFIGNTVPTLTGSRRPWAYPYPLRPACPQLCPHPSCCTP